MKSKAMIPLLLGLVVGLAAIKFGVDAIRQAKGGPTETITTVVARSDLAASIEITPDMLATVKTPKSPLVPDGAFTDPKKIVGRVTSKPIPQGTAISPLWLAPPGTPPGLTERIEEGYRAVSVKINEVSGVGGQISPGDFVDVIVVMSITRGRQTETISRIILQRIKVLAVGSSLGGPGGKGATEKAAKSVTLAIRDADVPKLHLAQTKGKVTLAMRGADDQLMADTGLASTEDWLHDEDDPVTDGSPTPDATGEVTPAERVMHGVGQLAGAETAPEEVDEPFAVVVINGPIRADGTSPVQQVVYKNRNSMKVVNVGIGRAGEGRSSSADSAESILRPSSRGGWAPDDERYADRYDGRSDSSRQPQDREMPEE